MTSQEKKEFLSRYLEILAEEKDIREEIAYWESKAQKVTASWSAVPSGGKGSDKVQTGAIKVAELRELRRMAAELAEQISALENEVKAEMLRRDTDTLSGLDYKVTWKEVTSSRFDTKAFKSAYASLYTAFTRPAVSRRFVIA